MIRCIGLLTGGGDCPGLNAVIRGVTRTAVIKYGWKVMGIENGFDGLLGKGRIREMTPWNTRSILPLGGTVLGTTNRGNPFHYPVEENGHLVFKDRSDEVMDRVQKEGMNALVIVGGDGGLSIARDFVRKGLRIVGVPKTIDNDLSATDVTFGFSTAVTTAMEAVDKLKTTAESHHRAMVLEVMGRYAGWIALEAGMAGGAHVILIPEIPFNLDKVCRRVEERSKRPASQFSILVVAEGAYPKGGQPMLLATAEQSLGVERLGGIGAWVADQIQQRLGIESRVTVLGHLQRGGTPTAFDRLLGSRFGVAAVDLLARGRFGEMVCLRGRHIRSVPIEQAVARLNRVSARGQMVRAAEALGIELGR